MRYSLLARALCRYKGAVMKWALALQAGFVLCALPFSASAHAENLVFLATSDAGEDLYVDRDSLVTVQPETLRRFPAVRLWAVNQIRAGRRTPARTERFQFSFNCVARTSTVLVFRNNKAGTKLQDWRAADLAHRYESPNSGSLSELAMSFACSGGRLPVAPIANANGDSENDEGPDDARPQP
jgi:hypothetical protein